MLKIINYVILLLFSLNSETSRQDRGSTKYRNFADCHLLRVFLFFRMQARSADC